MADRSKVHVRDAFLASFLALAAAGCATGYGAKGWTGGYSDSRIDDTHYLVTFNGNGHASKERVWNFWFYRCAELTAEKGFAYFDIEPTKKGEKQGVLDDPAEVGRFASARPSSGGGRFVPVGHGAPTFVYMPGPSTTVTRWNSSAVVVMFHAVPAGKLLFGTRGVLDLLGPYVKSNGSGAPPPPGKLFRGAAMKLGAGQVEERAFPDTMKIGYVDMKRMLAGVAEGKAELARLKASYARMQSELDAGKKELDRLGKDKGAAEDDARRAALEADLAARQKALQGRFARYQAELKAEEKKAGDRIVDRAGPLVEQIRVAQKLDTVTAEASAGFWDAEITDEVIRLYDERYPVPPAT